ncbi:MAG: sugar phosphate isomerase/epimerase [Lachnospiraceae bacterium]|nr:sugar phosphate isomerase/epimerase [Lachnospiraceae bacterium]
MSKLGLHCNYWNGTGAEREPLRLLELTAQSGANVMDFSTSLALLMSSQERCEYAAKAKAMGISLTLNGGISDAEISHTDLKMRQAGLQKCRQAIQAAAELNCHIWSGVIYAKWLSMPQTAFTPDQRTQMWKQAVSSVQELCDFAAPLGINICIEIVNRFEAYLINTAADGIRFIADIERPNIKLLLDVFHMNIEEDSICDSLSQTLHSDCLGHFHISESNRRLPGLAKTDINWSDIINTLKTGNYNGTIILESMVLSQAPAAHSFRTWRNMTDRPTISGLTQDAKKSIDFLNHLLQC